MNSKQSTVNVSGISLNKTSLSLVSTKTEKLIATVLPNNASNKKVIWTSSNSSVASVDASGLVTAKSEGTATITATTEDGKHTSSCKVSVQNMKLTADGSIGFTVKMSGGAMSSGVEVTAKANGGSGSYTSYNIKLYWNDNLIGESSTNSLFVRQTSDGTYRAVITVRDSKGNTATITIQVTKIS